MLAIGEAVHHGQFGRGRIVHTEGEQIVVNFVAAGVKYFTRKEAEQQLSETAEEGDNQEDTGMDLHELKETLREILREEGMTVTAEIADKWSGGEVVLKPGKPDLQEKTVPIDTLFHKIVMIRNQLRVLEQNINSSEKLSDADKLNLQLYLTRCYGSLTTFNVLFADKKDRFVGAKKQ